jgi:hypothetical protein
MFLDERGAGLRVTWHPERDLVVLSVWHDDSCVGTFRMLVQDVPRLSGLLAAALGDWVDQAGGGPGAGPVTRAGQGTGRGPDTGQGLGTGRDQGAGRGLGAGRDQGAGRGLGTGRGPGPPWAGTGLGAGVGVARGTGAVSLSVQRRIRLSRAVLKLRGLQDRRLRHRRRGSP